MSDWSQYAKDRQNLEYYRLVRRALERFSPGESIIDIGCGGTPVVYAGDFASRTVVNREPIPEYPAVETIIGKFPEVVLPKKRYSVVSCCQVLEHLTDAEMGPFVKRLFSLAQRGLVVSVPYKWREGACKHHRQDPIDRAKLRQMLGRQWNGHTIVRDDGVERIVVWFDL